MDATEMWWGQVPGPSRLVRHVVELLCAGKTVWINGAGLAWPDVFRAVMRESFYAAKSCASIVAMDVSCMPFEQSPIHGREDPIRGHAAFGAGWDPISWRL
jgi:hypothetical protein